MDIDTGPWMLGRVMEADQTRQTPQNIAISPRVMRTYPRQRTGPRDVLRYRQVGESSDGPIPAVRPLTICASGLPISQAPPRSSRHRAEYHCNTCLSRGTLRRGQQRSECMHHFDTVREEMVDAASDSVQAVCCPYAGVGGTEWAWSVAGCRVQEGK
jgi:hypothetical protein